MSTAEFGDPNGQAAAPAPAPDGLLTTPLTLSPAAPVAPVEPPLVPPAPQLVAPAPLLDLPAAPVQDMRDVPLGTLIFREGLLTEEQIEEALQDGMQRGKRLGEVLLERGLVSENDLGRLLAGQKGLLFVELDSALIDPAAVQLLPVEKARLHSVLPIGFQDGLPVVAVVDPSNDLVVENVRRALNCEPHLVVAGREALHRQIEIAYGLVPRATAAAPEQPVAPLVLPPPVEPVAVAPVIPAAPLVGQPEPVQPAPVAMPEPPTGEGVWLQTPEAQPVVTPPEPVQPVAEQPVVEPAVAEPVAITYAPVEPVAQPVEALAPLPVAQPLAVSEPVLAPEPVAGPEPQVIAAPVAQSAPVIETAPAFVPDPVLAAELVVAPEAVPVPEPVVVPEPVAAAEPVAPDSVPEPVLEIPVPPLPEPTQGEEADTVVTWSVVLRLADGDQVEIGAFHSAVEAKEHAQNVVRQVSSEHGWPFFHGRFIRPEAIISVDLSEPEGRWLGSAARRQAWNNQPPA